MSRLSKVLLVAGFFVVLVVSAYWWLPPLVRFAKSNSDALQGLDGLVALGVVFLGVFLFLLLRALGKASLSGFFGGGTSGEGSRTTQGGVSVGGNARAPITTGDHNRVEVVLGDRTTVEGNEELYRRLFGPGKETRSAEHPPAPQVFEGRDRELAELNARLTGRGPSGTDGRRANANTVVVTGIPGVGKTALATVAATDPEIREEFPDGTLWVSLGLSPDLVGALDRLARRLGAPEGARQGDIAQAQARVASLLSDKRVLLVVDDAYSTADAAAFRVAGARCATLLTTRDRDVARRLAPSDPGPLVLGELGEEDSLALLEHLAPEAVGRHRTESEELTRELGGLPLAIRVAGGLLAAEEEMGWGVEDLLAELREGRKVLEGQAPADRSPVPEGASPTVAALLRTSLERLSPEAGARFRALGAFPSKPVSFDLLAAARVWEMEQPTDARPTVRELADRGLLDPAGSGRFYLHPVLSSYARSLLDIEDRPPGNPNLRDAFLKHAAHYEQLLVALGHLYGQGGQAMMRALEVFDRERAHVEAGQRWAEDRYEDDPDAARVCSGYGSAAPLLILQRLKPSERRRWLESAVSAAEALGDEEARRGHEAIVATAYLDARDTERGFEILERHLTEARAVSGTGKPR